MGCRVANSIQNLFPIMSTSIMVRVRVQPNRFAVTLTLCTSKYNRRSRHITRSPLIEEKRHSFLSSLSSSILFRSLFTAKSKLDWIKERKRIRVNFCDLAKYLAGLLGLPFSLQWKQKGKKIYTHIQGKEEKKIFQVDSHTGFKVSGLIQLLVKNQVNIVPLFIRSSSATHVQESVDLFLFPFVQTYKVSLYQIWFAAPTIGQIV